MLREWRNCEHADGKCRTCTGFPSPALPGSGFWGMISARFASTPNL